MGQKSKSNKSMSQQITAMHGNGFHHPTHRCLVGRNVVPYDVVFLSKYVIKRSCSIHWRIQGKTPHFISVFSGNNFDWWIILFQVVSYIQGDVDIFIAVYYCYKRALYQWLVEIQYILPYWEVRLLVHVTSSHVTRIASLSSICPVQANHR